jgi:hypothetical protein
MVDSRQRILGEWVERFQHRVPLFIISQNVLAGAVLFLSRHDHVRNADDAWFDVCDASLETTWPIPRSPFLEQFK